MHSLIGLRNDIVSFAHLAVGARRPTHFQVDPAFFTPRLTIKPSLWRNDICLSHCSRSCTDSLVQLQVGVDRRVAVDQSKLLWEVLSHNNGHGGGYRFGLGHKTKLWIVLTWIYPYGLRCGGLKSARRCTGHHWSNERARGVTRLRCSRASPSFPPWSYDYHRVTNAAHLIRTSLWCSILQPEHRRTTRRDEQVSARHLPARPITAHRIWPMDTPGSGATSTHGQSSDHLSIFSLSL